MMDTKPFEAPVVVEFGQAGKLRPIRGAWGAADRPTDAWPLNRGSRHRDAVETCLKVLEGGRSTAEARRVLIEAARESGVLANADRLH
jgi:hypothetical protein